MRSNDTEMFFQSASQRDAALNMRQPNDFKILRKDIPVKISRVQLRTRIESGRDTKNYAIIRGMETATENKIPGLTINRIR